jgi:hypothetical protein
MARTFDDVLGEFEELFGSQEKTASAPSAADEVDSLVEQLKTSPAFDHQMVGGRFGAPEPQPLWEKVAESLAFAETIANLPTLQKIAAFEERAIEKGFSEKQISDYYVKTGSASTYRSIIDLIFS